MHFENVPNLKNLAHTVHTIWQHCSGSGSVFHKILTPGLGRKQKRRILLESTPQSRSGVTFQFRGHWPVGHLCSVL